MGYISRTKTQMCAILAVLSSLLLFGCSGVKTFHQVAQVGDTVAIATGWSPTFSRDKINVYIYPNGGGELVYGPDDPSIRAVVNMYPDPISSILVSRRTGQSITPDAVTYGNTTAGFAGGQEDWFQTVVFFDLPLTLPGGAPFPTGTTYIGVADTTDPNNTYKESRFNLVAGTGESHDFASFGAGDLDRQKLAVLERSSYFDVTFSGTTLPHAIQLELKHDTGVGQAYAVNPISGMKNISWTDDGSTLKVILMPSKDGLITDFDDFRFYVAGGITNLTNPGGLQVFDVQAYNINGEAVTGVSATIDDHPINITANDF